MPIESNGAVIVGTSEISSVMIGNMGVKSICVGDEKLYERPGGYVYICLDTSNKSLI